MTPVPFPLPVQSNTMLDFFKRLQPPPTTPVTSSTAAAGEGGLDAMTKTTTTSTKMSTDKKRKKGVDSSESKVVTNGANGHKSHSPPAKKRIAEEPAPRVRILKHSIFH